MSIKNACANPELVEKNVIGVSPGIGDYQKYHQIIKGACVSSF